MPPSLCVKDGQ